MSKVKVWDEKKKKFLIIGEVIKEKGQKILVKRVDTMKHYMRVYKAFGVDLGILDSPQFQVIRVVDENRNKWEVDIDTLIKRGFRRDFGHGVQIFLPLTKWRKRDDRQGELF